MRPRFKTFFLSLVIIASLVVISAVCWHSLEEMHYFKTFYPNNFTVEEAFYASLVELIKIVIISLPLLLFLLVSLVLLRLNRPNPRD